MKENRKHQGKPRKAETKTKQLLKMKEQKTTMKHNYETLGKKQNN